MVAELRDLVALCPDPIIAVNRAGSIILFNRSAERLLGYHGDEIIGRLSIIEVYRSAFLARDIKRRIYESYERQIEGYETQLVSKYGRAIDIRLSAKLIVQDGEECGSIGFFHDLTERVQLEAELRRMAITDNLTGLHNHRYFHSVLEAEVERAKRYRRPLTLMCIDMDHFKQVNDVLGHLEGNNALCLAARSIQKELRKTDFAFRYGGDEFMVLLLETRREEAEVIGERMGSLFERCWAEEWMPKPGCPSVSMSIGIAEFRQDESLNTLIRRADQFMYEAKRRKRA